MNGDSYISLAAGTRVLYYDDYTVLFNNNTADEILLDEEQLRLIKLLDGSRKFSNIIELFDESSRVAASEYICNLISTGMVAESENTIRLVIHDFKIVPYLESVLFDITSLCNLGCEHCYVSKYYGENRGFDLSDDQIESVLKDLAAMNVRDVSITGGEPTLHPQLRRIMQSIVARNMRLATVFTNGLNVDNDFADFVKNLGQKTDAYISLDGATPETNGIIRRGKYSPQYLFRKAIEAIDVMNSNGISVTVNTSLHKYNIGELLEMYELLKQHNVYRWRMAVPKPIGRFKENERKLQPSWNDVIVAYESLLDRHLNETRVSGNDVETPLLIEIEMLFRTEMFARPVKLYQPNEVACFYHKNRCSIKANGDVLSCGYFDDLPMGNIKTTSIRDIWLSTRMQSLKHTKISDVTGCKGCPVLDTCGTGCRALAFKRTGSMSEKDEHSCTQVQLFVSNTLPSLMRKFGLHMTTTTESKDFIVLS